MADIVKLERELDEIKKKNFWKLYIVAIGRERERAVDHCIKDRQREETRFFQGKVQAIDDILSFPERIIKELRKKSGVA
jgi:hypothetical protein